VAEKSTYAYKRCNDFNEIQCAHLPHGSNTQYCESERIAVGTLYACWRELCTSGRERIRKRHACFSDSYFPPPGGKRRDIFWHFVAYCTIFASRLAHQFSVWVDTKYCDASVFFSRSAINFELMGSANLLAFNENMHN